MSAGLKVEYVDPSELYRPEKKTKGMFRTYSLEETVDDIQARVRQTYKDMHTHQCVDYVRLKNEYWGRFDHGEMTVMEALTLLNNLVDASDPDTDVPNIVHAFQTAERLRKAHPDKDWLHLVGLIHDLGKVMALWGEPQYSTVGDTFVVGCKFADSIVYRETSFKDNPDLNDSRYNTKYGIYKHMCGLKNVLMSWGHDEYMYKVMKRNNVTLPEEGFYMVRFHSFYPWHTGGDYMHLCDEKDISMLPWIREFNKFDLYSKSDDEPDVEALKPYYQSLINKYMPGSLKW